MLCFFLDVCEKRRAKEQTDHPDTCRFPKGTNACLRARDSADAALARKDAAEYDLVERAELSLIATLQSAEDGQTGAALSKVDDETERKSRDIGCCRIMFPGTYGRANIDSATVSIKGTGGNYPNRNKFDLFRGYGDSESPAHSHVVDVRRILERWRVLVRRRVLVEPVGDLCWAEKRGSHDEEEALLRREAPEATPQALEKANATDEDRSEAPNATPQAIMEETSVTDEVPEATPHAMEDAACGAERGVCAGLGSYVDANLNPWLRWDFSAICFVRRSQRRAVVITSLIHLLALGTPLRVRYKHVIRLVYGRLRRRGRRLRR